jgi:ubiquinone/menaquinone biosynthesis C-methylase UbiE
MAWSLPALGVTCITLEQWQPAGGRERMMSEAARVLKPGGHIALVDFIFTDDCVGDLSKFLWRAGACEMDSCRSGFPQF